MATFSPLNPEERLHRARVQYVDLSNRIWWVLTETRRLAAMKKRVLG